MLKIAVPTNRPQAVVNYLDALAQLGARGVAVVWRDPIDAKGAAADAPHRMRVLFYRQFD